MLTNLADCSIHFNSTAKPEHKQTQAKRKAATTESVIAALLGYNRGTNQ